VLTQGQIVSAPAHDVTTPEQTVAHAVEQFVTKAGQNVSVRGQKVLSTGEIVARSHGARPNGSSQQVVSACGHVVFKAGQCVSNAGQIVAVPMRSVHTVVTSLGPHEVMLLGHTVAATGQLVKA